MCVDVVLSQTMYAATGRSRLVCGIIVAGFQAGKSSIASRCASRREADTRAVL